MIKIVVAGCCGKMGRRIVSLAKEDKNILISGALEVPGHPLLGKDVGEVLGIGSLKVQITDNIEEALRGGDCLIDFTAPIATMTHVERALKINKAMVIGTTGLTDKEQNKIREAASRIPIVMAPNMSIGVNLLFSLVGEVAKELGDGYQIEIVESHHKHKKDSPSGTALKLAQEIAKAKGLDLDKIAVYGRHGQGLGRTDKEIGIHAVRAGDIVGEHTVMYCGTGERIEITHRAYSRDTFAQGALEAAKFVVGKSPKLYNMQDVLKK